MSREKDLNNALKELHKITGLDLTFVNTPPDNDLQVLEQIHKLTDAYKEKYNKFGFIKELFSDQLSPDDIFNRAQKLHIDFHMKRAIYIIEAKKSKDKTILETLKHLFMPLTNDFIVEYNDCKIILVKALTSSNSSIELESTAKTIVDMLNTEAMFKVRVGYSSIVEDLSQIPIAYQQAQLALDIGDVFYMDKTIFSHTNLGIGRLIYHLPASLCETFLYEIFGNNPPGSFDNETLTTVNAFFENGLNIAETARQLYVHRNTLIYRLEKLQKWTGLDIRSFDDALLFKIIIMVVLHLRHKNEQERSMEKANPIV